MDGRALRVAMVTPRYLPERGGTAIHTFEVARRMVDRGHDVHVITTTFRAEEVGERMEDGVTVRRVRAWPRGTDWFFAPGVARSIRAWRPDLVHCQGYHTFVAPLAMAAAVRQGLPCIISFHSGGHSSRFRRAVRPLQIRLLRPLIRRCAAMIAVSEFEAGLFGAQLRRERSAFSVVPSGAELPDQGADEVDVEPEPLIVSLGRVESYKGHQRVIQALPLVRAKRSAMRVRVVGSGPYEGALRRLARECGVADVVEIGPVQADRRAELAGLLRSAAVVTVLSDYESQGLAAHEALALGRPLLVNDRGALSELRDLPNVRVVSPTDPPAAVAEAILAIAGMESAEGTSLQSWDGCVDQVLEVYEGAIRPPG